VQGAGTVRYGYQLGTTVGRLRNYIPSIRFAIRDSLVLVARRVVPDSLTRPNAVRGVSALSLRTPSVVRPISVRLAGVLRAAYVPYVVRL
jgi:hypothetical protein